MPEESYPQELRVLQGARLGPGRGRRSDVRDHLVGTGRARRHGLRRSARRRRGGDLGQPYGELESVKSVAEVYAPASGGVVAVNDALAAEPALVNADPYGQGWLIRVRLSEPSELDGLMDAAAYREFLATAGS